MKSQKWNKLIANKKSVMNIILNRCDKDTRAEITLGSSYQDNIQVGELIKFLTRVRTVFKDSDDVDIFFGSQETKIAKHHLQPTTIVEELLAAHLNDDAIWDNTNPCNISLDDIDGTKSVAGIDITKINHHNSNIHITQR